MFLHFIDCYKYLTMIPSFYHGGESFRQTGEKIFQFVLEECNGFLNEV